MILTIDTSVAVKWLVDEPGHSKARDYLAAFDEDRNKPRFSFSAPALLLLEIHHVLAKKFMRGDIAYRSLVEGFDTILDAIEIDPMDKAFVLTARYNSLAAAHRARLGEGQPAKDVLSPFSIYDCAFIEHARLHNQPLLTCDRKQADIAKAFGLAVEFIGVP